jgi:hypothetical protein
MICMPLPWGWWWRAPKGKANGAYKHGLHTVEAVEDRRQIRELIRLVNETLGVI